jgi:NDP-sugar pyrophosphorylase family protein
MLDHISKNKSIIEENVEIHPKATIISPSVIGKGTQIGEDAIIGPYAAVGEDVYVGKGTRIEDSIVFPNSWIESFSSMIGAIVGEGAIIGRWVKIMEESIIGDHAIINDNVTLTHKIKVCHDKEVDVSILDPQTVM